MIERIEEYAALLNSGAAHNSRDIMAELCAAVLLLLKASAPAPAPPEPQPQQENT